MAHVAAFTVSAYSTTAIRTGKPFNPLLGETYECDRTDDKGFRLITEQVSHHPPMLAQYVEQVTFVTSFQCSTKIQSTLGLATGVAMLDLRQYTKSNLGLNDHKYTLN